MEATEARDRRRMETYRNILKPESGAAESERLQARRNLDELEAKYPGPPPPKPPPQDPFAGWGNFTGGFRYTTYGFNTGRPSGGWWTWDEPPPDPNAQRRREEEARRQEADREARLRAGTIASQKKRVSQIPFWRVSPTLTALHDAETVWSNDETSAFKAEQSRNFKMKTPAPAILADVLSRLALAWTPALTAEEGKWVGQEIMRIGQAKRPSRLALTWLRMEIP